MALPWSRVICGETKPLISLEPPPRPAPSDLLHLTTTLVRDPFDIPGRLNSSGGVRYHFNSVAESQRSLPVSSVRGDGGRGEELRLMEGKKTSSGRDNGLQMKQEVLV